MSAITLQLELPKMVKGSKARICLHVYAVAGPLVNGDPDDMENRHPFDIPIPIAGPHGL